MPPGEPPRGPVPAPTYEVEATPAEIALGADLYHIFCLACHGPMAVGGGSGVPDLRYMTRDVHRDFQGIVRAGLRVSDGMPAFGDRLSEAQVRDIQAWLLLRARASASGPDVRAPQSESTAEH